MRRSLDVQSFGLNLVDIPPGEQIPEHDEADRDQEEVFFVVAGSATMVVDGEDHPGARGDLRAAGSPTPAHRAQRLRRSPRRVLIASAPRSSGYEPMEWA